MTSDSDKQALKRALAVLLSPHWGKPAAARAENGRQAGEVVKHGHILP
jgi:hypothetical protein